MSIFDTTLALVATNIGGGIVGVPFAMYNCGAIFGTFLVLFCAGVTMFSIVLLLKTKVQLIRVRITRCDT